MKKIYVMGAILSFLFITKFNAQTTYVPDDNFEQGLINLGYDSGSLDNYGDTSKIEDVEFLNLNDLG